MTNGRHNRSGGVRLSSILRLWFWLADQGNEKAEENGGCNPPGSSGGASGERADEAVLADRLFDPLGQQMAKAGEGHGGPRAAPVHQVLVLSLIKI